MQDPYLYLRDSSGAVLAENDDAGGYRNSRIVFTAPSPGNVFKVRPDGTGLKNLTKQDASGFQYLSSSFSPDGMSIVSARTPGAGKLGAADLVVMKANGTKLRPLTKTTLWESAVDWGRR